MRNRLCIITAGLLLTAGFLQAEAPAILERTDGKAWRLSLRSRDNGWITARLENASSDRRYEVSGIRFLDFTGIKLDEDRVEQSFCAADYDTVISTLEPALQPYLNYASISNNMENVFVLLMDAYSRKGDSSSAVTLAQKLKDSSNQAVAAPARIVLARSAVEQGRLADAKEQISALKDPVARLYLTVCLERAQGSPEQAIQTAVQLIAEHGNDMKWLPPTELLCAQLYRELGLLESAAATARQAASFYEGTNIGAEARALHAELEKELAAAAE